MHAGGSGLVAPLTLTCPAYTHTTLWVLLHNHQTGVFSPSHNNNVPDSIFPSQCTIIFPDNLRNHKFYLKLQPKEPKPCSQRLGGLTIPVFRCACVKQHPNRCVSACWESTLGATRCATQLTPTRHIGRCLSYSTGTRTDHHVVLCQLKDSPGKSCPKLPHSMVRTT
jgi:hypothetical protein